MHSMLRSINLLIRCYLEISVDNIDRMQIRYGLACLIEVFKSLLLAERFVLKYMLEQIPMRSIAQDYIHHRTLLETVI